MTEIEWHEIVRMYTDAWEMGLTQEELSGTTMADLMEWFDGAGEHEPVQAITGEDREVLCWCMLQEIRRDTE